jgi:predicted MarR family transcription regulator
MDDSNHDESVARNLYKEWHLAHTIEESMLTDFEFSFMHCMHAFERWLLQAARALQLDEISSQEIIILHVVRMMDRGKDASTVAHLLNRDDLSNVQYSLRKLEKLGLITREKFGNTSRYCISERGRDLTERYAAVRRNMLVRQLSQLDSVTDRLENGTELNELLAGFFDVAARRAATYGGFDSENAPPSKKKQPPKKS